MAAPTLPCLRGRLVVAGKSPDGDSVRFVPDTPARLDRLRRAWRLRRSSDGSVQLRLDAVDAPELGYGPAPQPRARAARDALLARCGFTGVRFGAGGQVTEATPATRPAAVLSGLVDPNGRPVAFLLAGETELPDDGDYVPLDDALVDRTVNAALLRDGDAYATLYESTAAPVRERLRAVAREARAAGRGLWPADRTSAFRLTGLDDLGPDGALVLPKLYRRCVDFLRDEDRDGRATLRTWLAGAEAAGRGRDDLVLVGPAREPVRLSSLVEHDGERVRFTADPLDLTVVEA